MTTNYYARVDYTYQGGSRIFSVPFDYIKEEYLNVFINDEICTEWTTLNVSQIEIDNGVDLSVGDTVTIIRATSLDERIVVFSDTSILNKDNQNLAHEQVFDVVQEVYDSLNSHKQDVETLKPYVKTLADNIDYIVSVDGISDDITAVAQSVDNVDAVAENKNNINTVAGNLASIGSVSQSIANVNAVGSHISEVHTVSNNIDAISDFVTQKDMINQSKALVTGNVSDDSDVLEQIKSIAHSTFDLSKFTVTGTPTITDDGIASGFGSGKNLNTSTYIPVDKDFEIEIEFTVAANDITGIGQHHYLLGTQHNSSVDKIPVALSFTASGASSSARWTVDVIDSNNTISTLVVYVVVGQRSAGDKIKTTFRRDTASGKYIATAIVNGEEKTPTSVDSSLNLVWSPCIYLGIQKTNYTVLYFNGSIDLKQFAINVDGVPVFSGNKTGVDTYTINSSTVTVPYTLSKTGSKIADSIYRTQVQAVYNEFGYAPYYTLSDSDFTLPQGELYGMLGHKADNTEWVYADDTADANLISSDTSLGTVDLTSALSALLPNDGYTYECLFRYDIHRDGSTTNPGTNIYYTVKTNSLYLMSDEIDSRGETNPDATVGHGGQFTGIIDSARNLTLTISSTTAGVTFKTTHMHLVAYRKLS